MVLMSPLARKSGIANRKSEYLGMLAFIIGVE
jgi:hypothetical protein